MHELSVCQSLIDRAQAIAAEHDAERIVGVTVRIGPLSGVEPALLAHAFPLAGAGTLAQGARLVIESLPLRVHCDACDADTDALPNRLLCGACGDHRTRITSGDELLLASVELEIG